MSFDLDVIRRPSILVVDDTPHNVKLLVDLLSAKGYQVKSATSGPDALRSIAEALEIMDV